MNAPAWPFPSRADFQPTPTISAEANAAVCGNAPTDSVHQPLTPHTRRKVIERAESLANTYRERGDIAAVIRITSHIQLLEERA